jgi:hypothetical protein
VLATTAILASTIVVAECSWNNPGANRYQGRHAEAIHRYTDIPTPIRNRLSDRMRKYEYDDVAEIRRDEIRGRYKYTDLRYMHFGKNKLCRSIDMSRWSDSMVERGLVYCESEHCIIVPTICGNVSRVTRVVPAPAAQPTAPQSQPAEPPAVLELESPAPSPAAPPLVPVAPPTFSSGVRGSSAEWALFPPIDPYRPPMDWCCGVQVTPPMPISEPKTWLLMGLGLAVLTWIRRRK